jgi:hypothetical protein
LKKYYQILPIKIKQDLKIIADLIEPEIKGFSVDNLTQIFSIISTHVQKSDGWAPLKMLYIKKIVPQGNRYMKQLIDLGIVEKSKFYIPGEVSFKYRFAEKYQSKFVTIPLKNPKLQRRIERAHIEFLKDAGKTVRNHSEQTQFLKLLEIENSFKDYLQKSDLSVEQFNSMLGAATRIQNKDIFYSVDNTSGRFHSNVTNLSKHLRPYLKIKNESLVNIDVKNSQPYLSTILLTNPGKVSWMTENPAFAMLLQTLKVSLNEDVKHYISLVISGRLYEFLMDEFEKKGLILTRPETKRQVLRILFARNRTPKDENNKKARQIFKNNFPTVHRIFSKIRGSAKGDKFTSFKRFSILLQRIESYLMLDVILKRIYKELPGTIAITIHDSIMTGILTLTNNVEAVRKIIIDEMQNFVGFEPKIKIEGIKEEKGEKKEKQTFTKQYDATTFVSCN